jgi:hypothetical protein
MPAIFDLYREYYLARLAEMRNQPLLLPQWTMTYREQWRGGLTDNKANQGCYRPQSSRWRGEARFNKFCSTWEP